MTDIGRALALNEQAVTIDPYWATTPDELGRYAWRVEAKAGDEIMEYRSGTATTPGLAKFKVDGYTRLFRDLYREDAHE
jgi:hypothetical protein